MSVISLCTIRVSEHAIICTSHHYHLISVYFGELSPSTTGVTFTVVCSNNVMSCIEEETLELSLLQVSLFKISSEATNITSFAINCNRSSNFNSLHPHTDYVLIICFSDLQCINTTFITGNSKIITYSCLINELTQCFYCRCNVTFSSSP